MKYVKKNCDLGKREKENICIYIYLHMHVKYFPLYEDIHAHMFCLHK